MNAETAVAVRSEPASEATSMIQVIERAAANPAIDVEKMERLLAMQERILARNAETAFNVAMSAAQRDVAPISADATNPQTHSKYATYAKLDGRLRPIYTKHGFALSFDEGDSPKAEHIRVLCHVSHIGGHSRTYHKDMPADGKGAKGGDVMTKTHAAGAAMSYGMRYLLKGIFNVAIGEEDRDGNDVEPTLSEEQIANITALMTEVGANKVAFFKYMKIDSLDQILACNYTSVIRTLEAKRRQVRK